MTHIWRQTVLSQTGLPGQGHGQGPDLDQETMAAQSQINKHIVETLYKALSHGDMEKVASLVASDLEWWFHGPPLCHDMMKVLTGDSPVATVFRFEPRRLTGIGACVIIAEGWEADAYWVHVWMLKDKKDGLITHFREYFNTRLTVRDTRRSSIGWQIGSVSHTLWQSQPRDLFRRTLPGLLLAI